MAARLDKLPPNRLWPSGAAPPMRFVVQPPTARPAGLSAKTLAGYPRKTARAPARVRHVEEVHIGKGPRTGRVSFFCGRQDGCGLGVFLYPCFVTAAHILQASGPVCLRAEDCAGYSMGTPDVAATSPPRSLNSVGQTAAMDAERQFVYQDCLQVIATSIELASNAGPPHGVQGLCCGRTDDR